MLASNRALHIFIIRSWKGVKKYENVVSQTSSVRRHFNFTIECQVHDVKIRVFRVKCNYKSFMSPVYSATLSFMCRCPIQF